MSTTTVDMFYHHHHRYCRAGWETRSHGQCVACPPGMYRQTADRLCKLCPKGEFADDFGSPHCAPCPRDHTTRGLGSRAESHCYYHHGHRRQHSKDNGDDRGAIQCSENHHKNPFKKLQLKSRN